MKTMPLNNDWLYKSNFHLKDLKTLDDFSEYLPVRLPHTNIELPLHYFDPSLYQFECCYKHLLPQISLAHDEEAILHFEGVMLATRVYIGEHFAFEHKGGYTPFSVNVTPFLHGEPHEQWITVHVDATERADIPPYGGVVDFLTYGGIYREVWLEVRNKQHFKAVRVLTPSIDYEVFEAQLTFGLSEPFTIGQQIIAKIYDKDYLIAQQIRTNDGHAAVDINAEEDINASDDMNAADDLISMTFGTYHAQIKSWDMENPKLYTLILELVSSDGKNLIDRYETPFGFRTAEFKQDGFFLNGKKVKLRGLNRHQSYPYVGNAMPKSAQALDADILKYELGVNIVRSSHYPPSRHFLERCDEIGLLVFDEIPGWQHIGDLGWQSLALESVEAMILRDINHPSIVIWGVRINESPDSDALYEATNALARKLDPSRSTGGVRNFAGSHLLEDVYTYNDFVHRGSNQALEAPMKIAKKSVPYLITEHNGHMYPTKSFDSESKRIEHALRHARVLNQAYGTRDIAGAIGWCMADYNTHKDFGSGDMICYHGVLDMFRLPKYAAALYASQSDEKPVMTIASNLFGGDFDAAEIGKITVFTNCDDIKVFKNDVLIKSYAPTHSDFSDLPHPPIIVDDLIGDLIKDNERFTPKDAASIKKILMKYTEVGNALPLLYKLRMGLLFFKYKMTFDDATKLYGKYIATWGEASTAFRFEGYKQGERVRVVEKRDLKGKRLNLKADSDCLIEAETYDVVRIVVTLTDSIGQPFQYANAVVKVSLEGPIEIIGPSTFALIAGGRVFWVKSTGQTGAAKVSVSIDDDMTETLSLEVKMSDVDPYF
jgi:beta-galactosidase